LDIRTTFVFTEWLEMFEVFANRTNIVNLVTV